MRRTLRDDLSYGPAALRQELSARNLLRAQRVPHELSAGHTPAVLYSAEPDGTHGNFYLPAYRRIRAREPWHARLQKAYTGSANVPHRHARVRRELDAATSSDALLMSIFCAPAVLTRKPLQALLGLHGRLSLDFGYRVRVPLTSGHDDRTEADLAIRCEDDLLLLEAKLTESGFQSARPALLERYPAFPEVFQADELPRNGRGDYLSYQLIRTVLAAQHSGARFALVLDARRPDLREQAFRIFAAVRMAALRSRLQLCTWQEIAGTLPAPLQTFLQEKYGIAPA